MKKTLIALTDELRAALDHLAAERDTHIGPLIESLLRTLPAVKKSRDAIGVAWSDRPPRGYFGQQKNISVK